MYNVVVVNIHDLPADGGGGPGGGGGAIAVSGGGPGGGGGAIWDTVEMYYVTYCTHTFTCIRIYT